MNTRLIKGNNLENRNVRVRFWSCGTVGYGPTLNKKGVDLRCDQVGSMTENNLSTMSATTSVPRARDEENHFPAR